MESEKDRRPIDAAAAPSAAAGEQGILLDGLNVKLNVLPAIRLRATQPLLLIAVRTTDDGTGNTMLDKADDKNRNIKENLACSKNETMLNNLSPKWKTKVFSIAKSEEERESY